MCNENMMKAAEKYGAEYFKNGRVLVWHDEFDEGAINCDKWCFFRTMSTDDRIYYNGKETVRVEDGQLHMQAHRTEDPKFPFALSEGFTTKFTMNWKYGYLEMRAKIPFRHGAWPSFWALSSTVFQKTSWICESDIFEVFSNEKEIASAVHKWGYSKHASIEAGHYVFENHENLNDEYHVYGYEWTPEYMAFFVDGQEYTRVPIDPVKGNFGADVIDGTSAFHDFQFIIMNNEMFTEGSAWKPDGWAMTDEDQFPIDYYIDWVRLYQNPETEQIKLKPEIDEVLAAQAEKS